MNHTFKRWIIVNCKSSDFSSILFQICLKTMWKKWFYSHLQYYMLTVNYFLHCISQSWLQWGRSLLFYPAVKIQTWSTHPHSKAGCFFIHKTILVFNSKIALQHSPSQLEQIRNWLWKKNFPRSPEVPNWFRNKLTSTFLKPEIITKFSLVGVDNVFQNQFEILVLETWNMPDEIFFFYTF